MAFTAFEFYTVGFEILPPLSQRATMLAFAAVLVFLLYPTASWTTRDDLSAVARIVAAIWDYLLIAAAIGACGYLIVNEADLADRIGAETRLDLMIAYIGPVVVLDMVRRVAGLPLFFVCLTAVVYAYWGDVVLIRTGQMSRFLAGDRKSYEHGSPGLAPECASWFHRHDVAAYAIDSQNPDPFPPQDDSVFLPFHLLALRDMGMLQGQNWNLEPIADACAEDRRYTFLLSATPEPFTGASGAPVAPVAVR